MDVDCCAAVAAAARAVGRRKRKRGGGDMMTFLLWSVFLRSRATRRVAADST